MAMKILTWRPYRNPAGTMRGWFSVELPSGMVLNDCKLMVGPRGAFFIGLPSVLETDAEGQPRLDPSGKRRYRQFVDFNSRAVSDRFRDAVLEALRARHPEAFGELL